MKAFDTISPSYYEKEKSLQQISKRSYFVTEKKQSIQIPFSAKVQVKAISHELRKPKVHVIKTKEPHVHILESKGKGVLGVDTGGEEQGQRPIDVRENNNGGGFFGVFRNANIFQRHNTKLQQDNVPVQQHINQSRNPFELLKQHLWKQPQPIQQQSLPINGLGYGLESHMAAMQQQQQQRQQHQQQHQHQHQQQNSLEYLNESKHQQEQHNIEIPDQIIDYSKMQNLQQSYVRPVELQNIRASFPQSQLQQSLGDRLLNFFKSLTHKPSSPQQHQQISQNQQHQQHLSAQNLGYNHNQMIEKSEVQQYQQLDGSKRQIQHKDIFQQSIVQQYHEKN